MRQGVRVKRFEAFECPGCGLVVRARGALEILHQCAKRNNRLTSFKRVAVKAVA